MKSETSHARIHFMDEVRGFAVLCMIFYHAFYSLAFVFGLDWGMRLLLFFMPAEPFFAGLFIFISGISSDLSHSNLIRGAKLLVVALLVTLVTVVFLPEERILFGILHFLSCAMLLFGCIQKPIRRIPMVVGLAVCVVLYLATFQVDEGIFCFAMQWPKALYQTDWLAPLGFHSPSFYSADYFPILPWIFVFLAGTFVGRLAAAGRFPKWMYTRRIPPLSWLGRHALIVYIVHQPVIFALAYGVQALVGLLV